jgi:hypothetical protein
MLAVDPHEFAVSAIDHLAEREVIVVGLIISKRTRSHALAAACAQLGVMDYYVSHRVIILFASRVIYFLIHVI